MNILRDTVEDQKLLRDVGYAFVFLAGFLHTIIKFNYAILNVLGDNAKHYISDFHFQIHGRSEVLFARIISYILYF